MKFEIMKMATPSQRPLLVATLDKGNEVLLLDSEDEAQKVKAFVENIFSVKFKEMAIDTSGDEGALIVRCDGNKAFSILLDEKEQSDGAAIIWFIKRIWQKQRD